MKTIKYIGRNSTVISVSLYRNINEIVFIGFCKENSVRKIKDENTIGMWKIKKLK